MPDKNWTVLVRDMIDYAERAQLHIAGLDFKIFREVDILQDGVIRCLEVIGEAARHVPPEIRAKAPTLPWEQIVQTRNILAHHYASVDLDIVWRVATERLPELIAALRPLLDEIDES